MRHRILPVTNELLQLSKWNLLDRRQALRYIDRWNSIEGGSLYALQLLQKFDVPDKTLVSDAVRRWKLDFRSGNTEITSKDMVVLLSNWNISVHGLAEIHTDTQEEDFSLDSIQKFNEGLWEKTGLKRKNPNIHSSDDVQSMVDGLSDSKLHPDFETYEILMRSYLFNERGAQIPKILEEMQRKYNSRFHNRCKPGRIHYELALSGYAQTGRGTEAQNLIDSMVEEYNHTLSEDLKPTGKLCATVIAAHSRSGDSTAPEKVEKIMSSSLDRFLASGDRDFLLTRNAFVSAMVTWTRSRRNNAAKSAQRIFDAMAAAPYNIEPSISHYGALIDAWCSQGDPKRADLIFTDLYRRAIEGDIQFRPDTRMVTSLCVSWLKSGFPNALQEIKTLFVLVHELDSKGGTSNPVIADIFGYLNSVPEYGEFADVLLRLRIHVYQEQLIDLPPSNDCFPSAMRALIQAKANDLGERVESLLKELIFVHDNGLLPVTLDEECFVAAIRAWTGSTKRTRARHAQEIFDQMLERHSRDKRSPPPTTRIYSAMINFWAREGNAGQASVLLQHMYNEFLSGNVALRPHRVLCNSVISAWSRSLRPNALDHADQTLGLMRELGESDDDMKPDVYSYSSMIWCCREKQDGDIIAEDYFREMLESYANGMKGCKPNEMVYEALIYVLSKAGEPARAQAFLEQMLSTDHSDCGPILRSFSLTMNAWNRTSDKTVALEKVEALFHRLLRTHVCRPNNHIFAAYLAAIDHGAGDKKRDFAQKVVLEMRKCGNDPDKVVKKYLKRCGL